MSGRTAPHYGFRVPESMVPVVEVYLTKHAPDNQPNARPVSKRVYGFTVSHAITRAQRWMRQHGDPR